MKQARYRRGARARRGIALIEILAAATAAMIVLALVIPVWSRARRFESVSACMSNLRMIHRAESSWESSHPGQDPGRGKTCWTKLAESPSPFLEWKILSCPLVPRQGGPGVCDYLGPAGDPGKAAPEDPVGCDDAENHGDNRRQGGNILRRSGDVVNDRRDLWFTALRFKCRP